MRAWLSHSQGVAREGGGNKEIKEGGGATERVSHTRSPRGPSTGPGSTRDQPSPVRAFAEDAGGD